MKKRIIALPAIFIAIFISTSIMSLASPIYSIFGDSPKADVDIVPDGELKLSTYDWTNKTIKVTFANKDLYIKDGKAYFPVDESDTSGTLINLAENPYYWEIKDFDGHIEKFSKTHLKNSLLEF